MARNRAAPAHAHRLRFHLVSARWGRCAMWERSTPVMKCMLPQLLYPSPEPQHRAQGLVGPEKTIRQSKSPEILAAVEEFRQAVAPGFCRPQEPLVATLANPVAELGRTHAARGFAGAIESLKRHCNEPGRRLPPRFRRKIRPGKTIHLLEKIDPRKQNSGLTQFPRVLPCRLPIKKPQRMGARQISQPFGAEPFVQPAMAAESRVSYRWDA